jgi:hypothetical protein
MMKRRIPPAIIKSETVIPKRFRMTFPTARKIKATIVAVTTDCTIIRLIFGRSSPSVKFMNMGSTPMTFTAINMGKKHNQNLFMGSRPYGQEDIILVYIIRNSVEYDNKNYNILKIFWGCSTVARDGVVECEYIHKLRSSDLWKQNTFLIIVKENIND